MTKRRAPLTHKTALARIIAAIGIDPVAAAAGRSIRTVYDWADEDSDKLPNVVQAREIDRAFHDATGGGFPLLETTEAQLGAPVRVATKADRLRSVARVIREAADAENALLIAACDDAPPTALQDALREVDEAIAALSEARAGVHRRPP